MIKPLKDWNKFWFEPQTAHVLGLARIAIGLITIYSYALFAKDVTVFFSDQGVLTSQTLALTMTRDWHSLLYYITSPLGVKLLLALLFIAAFSFTIGFKTRASAIILFVLVASFNERNNLVLNSGDTVLRLMIFFFIFSPAGRAYAVDSLMARLKIPESEAMLPFASPSWAQRMMQIQVAVIYFVTAYAKSRGELWHGGEAIYYVVGLIDFHITGVEQLMNYPLIYSALTFVTLFVELSLPFLLFFRATRPYAVVAGIGLHAWTMVFMLLPVFPILMMSTYIIFFSEDELGGLLQRIRTRLKKRGRVFFDGHCPLCLRSRKIITLMDLFARVDFVDFRPLKSKQLPKGVDLEKLEGEMHLVTPKGKVLKGFEAFRWMSARIAATFWLTPFFFFPGVPYFGKKLYRWVARNRLALVKVKGADKCPLHGCERV